MPREIAFVSTSGMEYEMNWMMNFTHGDLPNQQKTKGLRIPSIKNINICLDRLATPFLSPFIISDTKSTKAIAG